jgi:hypothetical protein
MHCSVTYTGNVQYTTLVSDTASLVRTVLTASPRNAGQLILVNYEGQVMPSLLLLVNCYSVPGYRLTAVSVIATGQVNCCRASQLLFHLMLQEHANSLC